MIKRLLLLLASFLLTYQMWVEPSIIIGIILFILIIILFIAMIIPNMGCMGHPLAAPSAALLIVESIVIIIKIYELLFNLK